MPCHLFASLSSSSSSFSFSSCSCSLFFLCRFGCSLVGFCSIVVLSKEKNPFRDYSCYSSEQTVAAWFLKLNSFALAQWLIGCLLGWIVSCSVFLCCCCCCSSCFRFEEESTQCTHTHTLLERVAFAIILLFLSLPLPFSVC